MPIVTEPHPAIPKAPADCTLWRFMSVTKFVSLLSAETLVFPQVALLASRDPKEGQFTNLDHQIASQIDQDDTVAEQVGKHIGGDKPLDIKTVRRIAGERLLSFYNEMGPKTHYVSCWNMSDHEPAQLWSMYASETDGVAIKSSIPKISKALSNAEQKIYLGSIKYQNYDHVQMPVGNLFFPIYHKRIEFINEQELRLCILHHQDGGDFRYDGESNYATFDHYPPVISVPCDLKELISEIIVAPFADPWVVDAIENLVAKYELSAPVRRSSIAG